MGEAEMAETLLEILSYTIQAMVFTGIMGAIYACGRLAMVNIQTVWLYTTLELTSTGF